MANCCDSGDGGSVENDELCYEIKHSEELGRYLIAKRDIKPLEVVINEKPLVCAPADDPNYEGMGRISMCLGCFARMPSNSKITCSKCLWPVCDIVCQSTHHHSSNECSYFTSNKISFKTLPFPHLLNETIFILRCLLFKRKYLDSWTEIVLKFEHHSSARKTKEVCMEKDRKVFANLMDIQMQSNSHSVSKGQQEDLWFDLDEDEVIQISGIINVNAFSSTKLEDECRSRRVRRRVTICQCLYPTATLLAHQCVPNASWTISTSPHFEQTIRSTVLIPKGTMISIAYAPQEVLWPTLQRLISTSDVAHFICHCDRCLDPSEFGSLIGAIKCNDCEHQHDLGYLLPIDPVDAESIWECRKCHGTMSVEQVVKIVHRVERQFNRIKNSAYSSEAEVEELEELYEDGRENYFHPNHYLLHEISLRIVNRLAFSLYCLGEDDLERFLWHCRSLLRVSDIVSPGFCRARAIIQFYMSQALMVKARKAFKEKDDVGKDKRLEVFKPIYKIQKEAYLYFKSEDENDNKYRGIKGFNQYVACLVEEMEECLKSMMLE